MHKSKEINRTQFIVMQEASDAHSKTADSDTVSTYQVSSVQLVIDKKIRTQFIFTSIITKDVAAFSKLAVYFMA